MTEPENREAEIPETESALVDEALHPSDHESPADPEIPAASADAAPLPEIEDQEPEQAAAGEAGAEAAEATEPIEPTEQGTEAAEPIEATETTEAAPVPAQQLASRVEALERQMEGPADRARLHSRVQALRKRVEEAATDEREALIERLDKLDALAQEQLAENLRRKEELAVKAEALTDSTEWKSTSEAIKALQVEWKTIGPVPQERSQELWQRFRKAGNTFFERLQEHRKESSQGSEENLRLKEALVARAEELSESTDWKGTAEAIKALQAEWKTVGPAPREQADAVWKRFRKAADVFFDRRKEHSDALRKEQEENLRQKEALVVRAEELSQSTQWKVTVQAIKELQAEWRTVGPAPSNKAEGVWRRFRAAIDLFFERQSAYFAQRNQDGDKRSDQMLDALERKREQANRVRESIERDEENLKRWQASLTDVRPGERSDEIRAGLEAKVTDVEAKLPAKRQRLDELEASIREIAAKL
jgi:hypothetical protein